LYPYLRMLHRWNLLTKNSQIKNCFQKIESCSSLKWGDYSYITSYKKTPSVDVKSKSISIPTKIKDNDDDNDDYDDILIRASMLS